MATTDGVQANSKSEFVSSAASQHASLVSDIDSPTSIRFAFSFPEASRKIVVVVVMLVHVSLANVKAFTDDVTSESQASMRRSYSSSAL